MSIKTIKSTSDYFPDRLTHLHDPISQLYAIGANLNELVKQLTIGIVGSRKVTAYGRKITSDFAAAAAKEGIVVISGLALGVDSIAHQAALDVKGKTIAVLPGGIEKIYPSTHTGLARNIVRNHGALVTEYTGTDTPMRHQFIERNRIIAGLSDTLLITEAAENSGSLHTARFALELGKQILAVPGNINSPTSMGTNNLLKMGAQFVTSTEDILSLYDLKSRPATKQLEIYGDNNGETLLLKLLQSGGAKASQLLADSELETGEFQQHLTMLEIKGRVKPLGNDTWTLS